MRRPRPGLTRRWFLREYLLIAFRRLSGMRMACSKVWIKRTHAVTEVTRSVANLVYNWFQKLPLPVAALGERRFIPSLLLRRSQTTATMNFETSSTLGSCRLRHPALRSGRQTPAKTAKNGCKGGRVM